MMDIKLRPGRYLVAVSGGVDSMTLLDLLAGKKGLDLVVAHFNHGIRPDSKDDEELVAETAGRLGFRFEVGGGELGSGTSEEVARHARYQFLYRLQHKYFADAIVTAHHRDDLLETAVINILRGTGRRGLTAISENRMVLRPLLEISKKEILSYAKKHNLTWIEDVTNQNETYLRNYIRRRVLSQMSNRDKRELLINIQKVAKNSKLQNQLLATISQRVIINDKINRELFTQLPSEAASEVLIDWLKVNGLNYDRKLVNRLNVALRTARVGTRLPVQANIELALDLRDAHLERVGR